MRLRKEFVERAAPDTGMDDRLRVDERAGGGGDELRYGLAPGHGIRCRLPAVPPPDHFQAFLPERHGLEVVVGRHLIPEKYHLVHE